MPSFPHDTPFDELGYLDQVWVLDAEVNELAGGKIADGGVCILYVCKRTT